MLFLNCYRIVCECIYNGCMSSVETFRNCCRMVKSLHNRCISIIYTFCSVGLTVRTEWCGIGSSCNNVAACGIVSNDSSDLASSNGGATAIVCLWLYFELCIYFGCGWNVKAKVRARTLKCRLKRFHPFRKPFAIA